MEDCQNTCSEPIKELQVNVQIEFVNNAILDNDSIVSELLHRLDIVTVPKSETVDENKPELKPSLVPHADKLRDFGERIVDLTSRVRSTINRLEL